MSYQKLQEEIEKIAHLNSAIALLQWDMEVYMPSKGSVMRGKQLGVLSAMNHEAFVKPEMGKLLKALKMESLDSEQYTNVAELIKERDKQLKLSSSFVRRQKELISKAYTAWMQARKQANFAVFKPVLKEIFQLAQEKADLLGYSDHPYDALLDQYEPECTTAFLDPLFAKLKIDIRSLIDRIQARSQVDDSFLYGHFDKDKQWQYTLDVLKAIGYDFEAGRQDLAAHPFSISFHPNDVRVTTRVDEKNLAYIVWSTIHEGGHALYEQGLRTEHFGMPLGMALSLGIHESQSRLYENNLGRSLAFWKYELPKLANYFPDLKKVSPEAFFKGINKIEPSFIRTESDELHYHFHVIIRYEIEKRILEGSLDFDSIESFWNEQYQTYLGLEVKSPNEGILQDIHWAHASIGYFPTYSLGSLYAAQFYATAQKVIPNLEERIAAGDNKTLLEWLRKNIHQVGRGATPNELCEQVSGEPLNAEYFIKYANEKYTEIYNL